MTYPEPSAPPPTGPSSPTPPPLQQQPSYTNIRPGADVRPLNLPHSVGVDPHAPLTQHPQYQQLQYQQQTSPQQPMSALPHQYQPQDYQQLPAHAAVPASPAPSYASAPLPQQQPQTQAAQPQVQAAQPHPQTAYPASAAYSSASIPTLSSQVLPAQVAIPGQPAPSSYMQAPSTGTGTTIINQQVQAPHSPLIGVGVKRPHGPVSDASIWGYFGLGLLLGLLLDACAFLFLCCSSELGVYGKRRPAFVGGIVVGIVSQIVLIVALILALRPNVVVV